ncbi:MAG: DUF4124 domain-containing protein [Luteibacter sp.]|uniref:DUF4124 domain-containing protein n=1 Tax=Luteibacter sp. TaxID=1886636 RepID=UPI0028090040|nr:DUF4124 domain-containing protein [Luteibacter sp.]MDQ7994423.1 DUF4124 domain-containing protein [Luteibacter sp.]MDQ8048724.1 DUF4124 domain-containing protein [Luteibacter sp.]
MHPARVALAMLALVTGPALHAETVYKCVAAGQTIYQQTPCAKAQHQETIQLVDSAPADGKVAPMPGAPPPRDDVDSPEPPAPPAALPPRMYGCVRATDGKPYTSHNGNPEPYLAPSGVVGDFGGTLSDTYGNSRAAVASAPELNRGKGSVGALVNNNYIWVQDQCRALSPAETCRVLRDDADANQKAIRNAFKSDKPPLDAKDASLRRQLQACG